MKAYTFVHSYICGIQVGIQAGHSNVELMRKEEGDKTVREWADHHKTFVWLDGGGSSALNDKINIMQLSGLPYAFFNEIEMKCSAADTDDAGMVTAATVVLPTHLVESVDYVRNFRLHLVTGSPKPGFYDQDGCFQFGENKRTMEELKLIEMLAQARLKSL